MRIFLILAALFLLLAAGLIAFDDYYWTHVSACEPLGSSAIVQFA